MSELKTRLHWLMGLRVVVVTLMLGLVIRVSSEAWELPSTFSALIIFTYLITIVYALLTRYLTAPRADSVYVGASGDGFCFGDHPGRADRRHRKSVCGAVCDYGHESQALFRAGVSGW